MKRLSNSKNEFKVTNKVQTNVIISVDITNREKNNENEGDRQRQSIFFKNKKRMSMIKYSDSKSDKNDSFSLKNNLLSKRLSSQTFKLQKSPTPFLTETSNTIKEFSNQNVLKKLKMNNTNNSSNLKVIVRFRPPNDFEIDLLNNNLGYKCYFSQDNETVEMKSEHALSTPYCFDRIFTETSTQEEIFKFIGKETLNDVLSGYNGTIFTYGQSGSGKTFTLYGNDIFDEYEKGLIPRIITELFDNIAESDEDIIFQIKLSVLQIYKEVIYDLLTGEKDLKIKESPSKGIYVDNLSEVYLDSIDSFMEYINFSQEKRIEAATKLNRNSSRSHVIVILEVTQNCRKDNIQKKGTLNLVDLAGSEKVSKTGAVGETLEEAKKINLSLSVLGNVISSLTSIERSHVPYRDSKLTRILQESLGGNYKTSLIVTCSPHSYNFEESISTLKFAQRAKCIKNKVKMNIKLSYDELQKICENLKKELENANTRITKLQNNESSAEQSKTKIKPIERMLSMDSENIKYILNEEDEIINKNCDCECNLNGLIKHYKSLCEKFNSYSELRKEDNFMNEEKEIVELNNTFEKLAKSDKDIFNLLQSLKGSNDKIHILKKLTENRLDIDFFVNFLISKKDQFKLENNKQNLKILSDYEKLLRYFSLGFINYSINLEILKKFNNFMEKKNKALEEQNILLFDMINELIKVNVELTENKNNNNLITSLKKSINDKALIADIDDDTNFKKLKTSLSISKVAKLVSRKNLQIIKNINVDNRKSFQSYKANTRNVINNNNVLNSSITSKSSKHVSPTRQTINSNRRTSFCNEIQRDINNMIILETENKLNTLQDFLIRSSKEQENLKQKFISIQEDLSKIIRNHENDDASKKNFISYNESRRNDESYLQNLLLGYIDTATATRKFDGISFKYKNDHIEYFYEGGLSAFNKLPFRPLQTQICQMSGDDSVVLDDTIN